MSKLVKIIDPQNTTREYLHVLNGILGLTDKQLEVLTRLIQYDIEISKLPKTAKKTRENCNVLSPNRRKTIVEEIGPTTSNISLYKKKFIRKGILVKGQTEDSLRINPVLIPPVVKDRIQISIILKLGDNDAAEIDSEYARFKTDGKHSLSNK